MLNKKNIVVILFISLFTLSFFALLGDTRSKLTVLFERQFLYDVKQDTNASLLSKLENEQIATEFFDKAMITVDSAKKVRYLRNAKIHLMELKKDRL